MPGPHKREEKYSSVTGVIFLFNLIVGTGALALPGALQKSGFLLGCILILVLALFSFITVTFIVESLAAANAISRKRYEGGEILNEPMQSSIEETPLVPHHDVQENNIFEITEKYEIGQMGVLMSPKWCQVIIYASLCVYLFGDVAIYAVVMGKSGSRVLCTFKNTTQNSTVMSDDMPCWENHSISRINVYRIFVAGFICVMGPFVFFNLQKTKVLQILTSVLRWLAFFIMLIWSIYMLSTVGAQGHPPIAKFKSLPTLFGTLVYSFMCQHSIPGLLQPISNKRYLTEIIGIDYSLISVFYVALATSAVFTFSHVEDIYTLNFWEESTKPGTPWFVDVLAYFLALFPMFTISTNFPIIAITLRNNLRTMILRDAPYRCYYDKLIFPLVAIVPASLLALIVSDLHVLVGIVGSYAGACVQYLIPCLLVFFARSQTQDFHVPNIHASPFKSRYWIYAVYFWMVISLIFITINYVTTFT